jgi:hypothetical protein
MTRPVVQAVPEGMHTITRGWGPENDMRRICRGTVSLDLYRA